jgi:hypothetical protein
VPRPRNIVVLSKRIAVTDLPDTVDDFGRSAAGVIGISPRLLPDDERETFIHELLHQIFAIAATANLREEAEAIITFLSPLLYDTFRRNRDMVEWLMDDQEA